MTATANLCLHGGARGATVEEVANVPMPLATATWQPVSHLRVLEHVRETLGAAGYTVTREQLALNRQGQQFFAVLDLARTIHGDTATLAIGVRNSIDKSFPMGLVGGSRVFVCDNLAFSSDLIHVKRKHTRYGELRFSEAIAGAVSRLPAFEAQENRRVEVMQATRIPTRFAEVLTLRSAIDWHLLPLRQVPAVVQETRCPTFTEFHNDGQDDGSVSLWRLWNAYTHVLRGAFEVAPGRAALLTMRLQKKLLQATGREDAVTQTATAV